MRVGFLLPATLGLAGSGNGVRRQAAAQAAALERLGHDVTRIDPWTPGSPETYDILQFFVGGYAHHRIERRLPGVGATVFAPIIDTNASNLAYRVAAGLGTLHPKIDTLQGVYRRQALLADAVVCRSRFERIRIARGLGIPAEKIHVVLNGVDPSLSAQLPDLRKLNLPDDYLLFVGAYGNPRKNVRRLIEAIRPLGYPLVIAGSSAPTREAHAVEEAAHELDGIRLLGFMADDRRDALYARCRVFCLPSVYEGTGLAALEAGAMGARVVVTSRGGPPDYFGELAEYVDPFNVSSIRTAIERAWNTPHSPQLSDHLRQDLTWERSARELVLLYEQLLALR